MSRRSPDYAQGRYQGAGEARTNNYEERRQGTAWRGDRERSQSPVRRDANRRDHQVAAPKIDPYDEGITQQSTEKQQSHLTYQPYTAPANDRWDKGRDVQELQNPYGYAQAYANAQSYTHGQTAQAYAHYPSQAYHSETAVGLPYDSATPATYQDPRYETYAATDYAAGRGHDSRQQNPQSRDVIFLGLETTYTEDAVCPFDCCFLSCAELCKRCSSSFGRNAPRMLTRRPLFEIMLLASHADSGSPRSPVKPPPTDSSRLSEFFVILESPFLSSLQLSQYPYAINLPKQPADEHKDRLCWNDSWECRPASRTARQAGMARSSIGSFG